MKFLNSLIIIAFMAGIMACNSDKKTNAADNKTEKEAVEHSPIAAEQVAVYYFHSSRRCETCVAIENVSSKAIKEFYDGAITFESLNIENDEGAKKAEELGVKSSALIILRGEERIDITSEAFMYGRMQADKLKALIKTKIEPVKNI